jgi:hypothetical protein
VCDKGLEADQTWESKLADLREQGSKTRILKPAI